MLVAKVVARVRRRGLSILGLAGPLGSRGTRRVVSGDPVFYAHCCCLCCAGCMG